MRVARSLTGGLPLWAVAGVAVLVGLPAAHSLTWPMGRDQGIFSWVAGVVLDGGVPYEDAWDIKGPGTYYVQALTHLVLGRGKASIRIVDLALLLLAAMALWHLGRRSAGRAAGLVSAGLLVLWHLDGGYWYTAQPEGWAAALTVLAVVLALGTRPGVGARFAGAGVLLGVATSLKVVFAPLLVLAVPLASLAVPEDGPRGDRWRAVTAAGLGFAAVQALTVAWFAAQGALGDLLEVQFTFNRTQYAPAGSVADRWEAFRNASRQLFLDEGLVVAFPVAAAGLAWLWTRQRRLFALLATWLAVAVATTAAQGWYFRYHWLPVFPALALAAGLGVGAVGRAARAAVSEETGAPAPRTVVAAVGGAVLLVAAWGPVDESARWLGRRVRGEDGVVAYSPPSVYPDDVRVASYLRARTDPGDGIFVWGFDPVLYFLADRDPPSRFGYPLALLGRDPGAELLRGYRDELLDDLRRDPPAYVVVEDGDANAVVPFPSRATLSELPELRTFLRDGYATETTIGPFEVLRRDDA